MLRLCTISFIIIILSNCYAFELEGSNEFVIMDSLLFIPNQYNNTIDIISNNQIIKRVGRAGRGPGEFSENHPNKIAISEKYIFTFDNINRKLSVFQRDFDHYIDIRYADLDIHIIFDIASVGESLIACASEMIVGKKNNYELVQKVIEIFPDFSDYKVIESVHYQDFNPMILDLKKAILPIRGFGDLVLFDIRNDSEFTLYDIEKELKQKIKITESIFKVNKEMKDYYLNKMNTMMNSGFKINFPDYVNAVMNIFLYGEKIYFVLWEEYLSREKIIHCYDLTTKKITHSLVNFDPSDLKFVDENYYYLAVPNNENFELEKIKISR